MPGADGTARQGCRTVWRFTSSHHHFCSVWGISAFFGQCALGSSCKSISTAVAAEDEVRVEDEESLVMVRERCGAGIRSAARTLTRPSLRRTVDGEEPQENI